MVITVAVAAALEILLVNLPVRCLEAESSMEALLAVTRMVEVVLENSSANLPVRC